MDNNDLPAFMTDTAAVDNVVAQALAHAAETQAQLEPSRWTDTFAAMSDPEFRGVWATHLVAAGLPPTTLDVVFRYVAQRLGVGLGSVREQYRRQVALSRQEETHASYAQSWLDAARDRFGVVFADQGSLWAYNKQTKIYDEINIDRILIQVSAVEGERCRTSNDYRAIAQLAYLMCADSAAAPDDFPAGIAVGDKFFRVDNDNIIEEDLNEKHYAVFKVPCEPNIKHKAPLMKALEDHCFKGDTQQLKLIWQQIGAALFNEMWRMQKVALWLGEGQTGKSTWQDLLSSMFPANLVSAIPPHNWGEEYHAAGLAGKKLNLVGEIEDTHALDASFKNMTGGGKVHARHPTHRPFEYVPRASHVFSGNHLPATKDRGSAFWRRWSVIEFKHPVKNADKDRKLAEKIIASEMPYLIAKAIEGMKDLAAHGMLFDETDTERLVFGRWKRQTNSVEEFIHDEEVVSLGADKKVGKGEFFDAYTKWCADNKRHSMGRNKFSSELERVGAAHGIKLGRVDDKRVWTGAAILF